MTNTLILGGSGQCARHITRLLHAEGHTVHSVIRNAAQSPDIESLGGRPIVQSLEEADVAALATTMRTTGATTVLWCAGAGGGDPGRTRAVDRDAAIRSMDAAAAVPGVSRYILVSAVDVRDREARPAPEWYDDADRATSDRMWDALGPYMAAKLAADRSLVGENARRGLRYTIVRPSGLSNDPGKGTIAAGKVHLNSKISREDVASVVVQCMKQEGTIGLAIDCVGGETPIADAIAQVAKERFDSFAGRF